MKIIIEEIIFIALLSKRFSKYSGIVDAFKVLVISLVRLPKIDQASNEPIIALPIPIQVEAMPNFQPN